MIIPFHHRGHHWRTPDRRLQPSVATGIILLATSLLASTPSRADLNARMTRHRVSHLLIVGHGFAGVRLGNSPKRVASILGTPRSVQPPYWRYPKLKTRITFTNNEVTELWTESTSIRTRRGIGPGISRRRLGKTHLKVTCRTAHYTSAKACTLSSMLHGRRTETAFLILGTTVRAVEIRFR